MVVERRDLLASVEVEPALVDQAEAVEGVLDGERRIEDLS
jgi:hypothetical protein